LSKVEGDFDLANIVRVDVNSEGTPYVVTSCGDTWYMACDGKWMKLPGCATDIGVGRGGEVFKTGCDQRDGGYGIYRLFCKGSCNCNDKGCMRYRPNAKSFKGDNKKCYWFRIDGAAVRLDVAPSGYPYAIDNSGSLWGYDGTDWNSASNAVAATDVSISNEGAVFYTGSDENVYMIANGSNSAICGNGSAVTAGPYSQPFVISNGNIESTSKMGFN